MGHNLMFYLGNVKKKYKITFISTIIVGIVSQGMGLFNKLSFHDDAGQLFGVGLTYPLGRWMLDILAILERGIFGDGHYSLPMINGLFSIICIAVSACLIISLMSINDGFLCIFVGAVMVAFPVVTSMFGYMFTIHYYMLAMLMGIFGAYLICRKESLLINFLGIILMGCSVGVYQAFIPVILCVILFYYINYFYVEEYISRSHILKKIGRTIAALVLFMVFYFFVNQQYLIMRKSELLDYNGINKMGKVSLFEYFSRVGSAYKEYFVPSEDRSYYMYPANIRIIYIFVIITTIILSLVFLYTKIKKDKFNAYILGLAFMAVPLASNFIFVMVDKEVVHSLMVYAQVMPFVLLAWMLDKIKFVKFRNIIVNFICVLFMFLILMFCRFDNQCYIKALYAQQESISYFTTLITQIKSVDGYQDELPVSFVNEHKIQDKTLRYPEEFDAIKIEPYRDISSYVNDYVWTDYMGQWCGFYPELIDETELLDMPEIERMPSYPDSGAIKIIDGIVVVKF